MSKFVLFSYFRSSCSYRLRIYLHQKNVSFEIRPVNLLEREHKTDRYLRDNPQGLVPALQLPSTLGGRVLTQSLPVMEFLEEVLGETVDGNGEALLPPGAEERWAVRNLCQIIASEVQPVANLSVLSRVSALAGDAEKVKWAREVIGEGLESFERTLEKYEEMFAFRDISDEFSVARAMSLADVCLVPQVYNAKRFGLEIEPNFPRVFRIYKNMLDQRAVKLAHPHVQEDCVEELKGKIDF